ncbi:hypothetical protein LCGC14_1762110 [marine sediment metagenome]|uniref:Uncharacterized protein n=1 Tax=marine sediment metagenome TaxID=412755 RepID=A0A0F9H0P6_9ZZZZ
MEYTTIQIYREDLEYITNLCKKNENLRDKLHQIINKLKKEVSENGKKDIELDKK